ncbi:MAG: hypothetical protein U0670_08115 [Anaerolineae bacterium]
MSNDATAAPVPTPNPDLKAFERLIGTWKVEGGVQGQTSYEWMEGGFFLIQRFELVDVKGIEIIGHEQKFGEGISAEIKSRFYGYRGETFDYVYEMDGNTLTIWGGEKGSPAYYKGSFSADGNTLSGDWVYPGGGYSSVSTRVR